MDKLSLVNYTFNGVQVRIQCDEAGEPLFCAKDVCDILGYANARKAVADHVDQEDVTKRDTLTNGGNQSISYVNESGLYALIFGSKLPAAKEFKHWVTSVVLPSIRKTGAYAVPTKQENPLLRNLEAASFLYEKAGLVGNHLALALDRVAQKKTGESLLALGDVVLETKDNEVVYTPTELGKMMVPPISGREVNLRLIEAGLQVATGSKHGPYQPTQRGKKEGATLVDVAITGKAEPITHLKWPKAVIKLIDFEPVLDV